MEIVDSKRPHLIIENIQHFYNKEIFADVVIVIGEKRIPGHKLVFATACDYFKNKIRESTELIIDNVDGVSTSAIEDVINYIYTGKIDLKCVGEILKFVKHIGYRRLEELIMKYLIRNFSEIIHEDFFVNIPIDFLTMLINSEELYVKQEIIFDGMNLWITKDLSNRKEHLHYFLKSVKLYEFSEEFLFTKVEPLCRRSSVDVLQLFINSLMWIKQPALRANLTFTSTRNKRKEVLIIIDNKDTSSFDVLDDEVYMWRSTSVNITEKSIYSSDVFNGELYIWTECSTESFGITVIDLKERSDIFPSYEYLHDDCNNKSNWAFFCGGEFYIYTKLLGCIEKWNGLTNDWLEIVTIKKIFEIYSFATYNAGFIMFGYEASSNNKNEKSMKLKIYNIITKNWEHEYPMRKRTDFVTALMDDFLYIIGGKLNEDNTTIVERLNLNTGKWTYVEDLPRTCEIKGSVIFKGKIICVGTRPNCILEYDPDENEWRELPLSISRELSDPRIFRIPSDCVP